MIKWLLYIIWIFFKFPYNTQTKQVKGTGRAQSGKSKKKKTTLRYMIDCTHPVEDGIMDVANFVSKVAMFSPSVGFETYNNVSQTLFRRKKNQ